MSYYLVVLKQTFANSSKWLWFTYSLLVVEFAISSSVPWVLGKTIDSAIQQQYGMFWTYVACSVGGLFIGVLRRRIDTRIFLKTWKYLTIYTITSLFERNVPISKITARTNNVKMFTDFYEHIVPQIIKSSVYIVIASIVLFKTMGFYASIILCIMLVSLLASKWFAEKIELVIAQNQHAHELKEHYVLEKDLEKVKDSYNEINCLLIKKSDWDAVNWGVVDVCCIICELIAICILVNSTPTIGQITSTLMYVNSLCGYFSSFSYYFTYLKELKVAKESIDKD